MARGVAIVVLHYGAREDTLACLRSLQDVRWDGPLHTILVDNGSKDGTFAAVQHQFPRVHALRSDVNLGFAEGNNVGIRHALALGADDVLLLNNDTEVEPHLVEALQEARAEHPDAGALCPLIAYAEPPDVVWYAGACFDPRRGHHGRQVGYGERDRGQYAGVRETERLSGCAVLLPREVLDEVGLLDGDLFLQYEDNDLSLRIRATGRRIYVVGSAKVWHKVSIASGGEQSETIAYYAMRNVLAVTTRHAPLPRLASARREAEAVVAHLLHARRARRPVRNARAVLEGWRDFRRGRVGRR